MFTTHSDIGINSHVPHTASYPLATSHIELPPSRSLRLDTFQALLSRLPLANSIYKQNRYLNKSGSPMASCSNSYNSFPVVSLGFCKIFQLFSHFSFPRYVSYTNLISNHPLQRKMPHHGQTISHYHHFPIRHHPRHGVHPCRAGSTHTTTNNCQHTSRQPR